MSTLEKAAEILVEGESQAMAGFSDEEKAPASLNAPRGLATDCPCSSERNSSAMPFAILDVNTSPGIIDGGILTDAGGGVELTGAGAVAVYARNGGSWMLTDTIFGTAGAIDVSPDGGVPTLAPLAPAGFGNSVALGTKLLFCSSPTSWTGAGGSSVTTYAQEGGTWQASTISSPSGALSGFGGWWPSSGGAMAVSGSLLAVSTGQADHISSVYVYTVP